jgi:hypothetical protein
MRVKEKAPSASRRLKGRVLKVLSLSIGFAPPDTTPATLWEHRISEYVAMGLTFGTWLGVVALSNWWGLYDVFTGPAGWGRP